MDTKKVKLPAKDGWFDMDFDNPRLIGSQCTTCQTYYFPKIDLFCKNPNCEGEEFKEVKLSNKGRIWSYTNSSYQPPPPYIPVKEPYEPFGIVAVELEKEKLVILGQLASDSSLDEMKIGMEAQLVLDSLYEDQNNEYIIWKWKPITD